ncbi:ATP-binding protein, partial [Azospirillum brasilense]|nr:ATP-binding protein [Azospirillum brasilense]
PAYRRKLAAARAGAGNGTQENPAWEKATQVAATLPEDIQVVFLLLARAALDHLPCPSDAEVARACGSRSRGRARRLLTYMEQRGFVATRSGLGNTRSIALPALGWETALGDPNADDGSEGPEDGGLFATA